MRSQELTYDALISDLERAGLSEDQAHKALRATLTTLGERLDELDKARIADSLTPQLGRLLTRAKSNDEELYERATDRMGADYAEGRERLEVVCEVIGRRLGDDDVARIRNRLESPLADCFTWRSPTHGTPRALPGATNL